LNAFDAIGCVVTPAAGIGVSEVDPAGACFLEDSFDFVKDVAKVFDVEVECWFQTELSFPCRAVYAEIRFLPFISVLNRL